MVLRRRIRWQTWYAHSLIGYGAFQYEMKSGERVEWPIVSVARKRIT